MARHWRDFQRASHITKNCQLFIVTPQRLLSKTIFTLGQMRDATVKTKHTKWYWGTSTKGTPEGKWKVNIYFSFNIVSAEIVPPVFRFTFFRGGLERMKSRISSWASFFTLGGMWSVICLIKAKGLHYNHNWGQYNKIDTLFLPHPHCRASLFSDPYCLALSIRSPLFLINLLHLNNSVVLFSNPLSTFSLFGITLAKSSIHRIHRFDSEISYLVSLIHSDNQW